MSESSNPSPELAFPRSADSPGDFYTLGVGDALLIIDMQNDFFPGGVLPVPRAPYILPVINRWIALAREGGSTVVATRDWHPPEHLSFEAQGGPWHPHCIQGSTGAEFFGGLALPPEAIIISKGSDPDHDAYSAFHDTDLAEQLHSAAASRLWVCGVAAEYSVRETVIDAIRDGFEVHVIRAAVGGLDTHHDGASGAFEAMRTAGAVIEP